MDFEVIVIGSGFGGSAIAARTAKKWPGRVLLLERGKRYPMGSFARAPHEMARNVWNIARENRRRPSKLLSKKVARGLFDIRHYNHVDVVLGAGLGGGSLIYANVFLEPPEEIFAQDWPTGFTKATLQPYYKVARAVLGARAMPQANGDPRRDVKRSALFEKIETQAGRTVKPADINVFFGNDFSNPLPMGERADNRYGARQSSCIYCGECDVGCNVHAKNTTDLNYLYVAENKYGAAIRTESLARRIVPLDANGAEDRTAIGEHGYRVDYWDLTTGEEVAVTAQRVVLSAGTLGTTELLLRCRDVYDTLPGLSDALGKRFSCNGDFLYFAADGDQDTDPNSGPVITRVSDHNLLSDFDRSRAFVMQDAAFPAFASWWVTGARPAFSLFPTFFRILRHWITRWFQGATLGRAGFLLNDLLRDDIAARSSVLLCMGVDNAEGVMTLGPNGMLSINWPYRDNRTLYDAYEATAQNFASAIGGAAIPLPNWLWPFRNNVAVHPLGGCRLGDSRDTAVTSAEPGERGRVFGYQGLYVADGSLLPSAVGANPSATIAALAELVAHDMTGLEPAADGDL